MIDVDAALTRLSVALTYRLGDKLPARKYVTAGEVAYDCGQFAVSLVSVQSGSPGATSPLPVEARGGYMPWTMYAQAVWTSCVPVPANGVPSPASLDATGHEVARHAGYLMDAALAAYYACELFDECCQAASLGPVEFIGPDGGIFGVSMTFGIQLI